MRERQGGDVALVDLQEAKQVAALLAHPTDSNRNAAKGMQDTLRFARGARGIHDECEVVVVCRYVRALRGEGPVPHHVLPGTQRDPLGVDVRWQTVKVDDHGVRDRATPHHRDERRHTLADRHDGGAARLGQRMGQRLLAQVGEDSCENHPLRPHAVGGHEPLPPRLEVHRDFTALRDALLAQPAAEAQTVAPRLLIGDGDGRIEEGHVKQTPQTASRVLHELLADADDGAVGERPLVAAALAERLKPLHEVRPVIPLVGQALKGVSTEIDVVVDGGAVGAGRAFVWQGLVAEAVVEHHLRVRDNMTRIFFFHQLQHRRRELRAVRSGVHASVAPTLCCG
ncbi:hypothetical protein ABL78_8268 [Leptomonas seymouri]|uniref:Uncharacterized protein n=1 Tax=Leptomonas seymouri TaxID=5684 RepID=A0A0N0P2A3_LEPSE|nr:hypothetical protein ABL78_8268 [Leptomonas seymouri]|eukprot:KPI82719.1 hypothetical protein ABL78_8268 [Leptomonas seymouri]